MPGKKPVWRWTEKNGNLVRNASRGGIDWYRYKTEILEPKLLPFARREALSNPKTLVQEDNASPHAHQYQHQVYDLYRGMRLIWLANSPNLNMIEPCWMWMERETTKHGAATSEAQLKKDWLQCWKNLPQAEIQAWIERIPLHIQEVIKCGGGMSIEKEKGLRKELLLTLFVSIEVD